MTRGFSFIAVLVPSDVGDQARFESALDRDIPLGAVASPGDGGARVVLAAAVDDASANKASSIR